MNDSPKSFTDVVLSATKGIDYDIQVREAGGYITVAAIHGGNIEPMTSEIARAIADPEYNLYDFSGLRDTSNQALRISPLNFSEARLDALIRRSKVVLSIEGAGDIGMTIQAGGTNQQLKHVLLDALTQAGFDCRPSETPGIDFSPAYFFNRAAEGGVQLEFSQALRASLVDCSLHDTEWQAPETWNDRFRLLIDTIRQGMALYVSGDRVDLEKTLDRFERTTRLIPPSVRSGKGRSHDDKNNSDQSEGKRN